MVFPAVASKACYELVSDFLASDYNESLNNLKYCDNENILIHHKELNLPTLYPPCFDSKLHKLTQEVVLQTYNDFLDILSQWDINSLSISYNGGKDCLVQLIIYMAAVYQFVEIDGKGSRSLDEVLIHAVYVHTETEFIEQVQFLEESVIQYGLDFKGVYTLFQDKESADQMQIINELKGGSKSGSIECLFSPTPTLPCGFLTFLEANPHVKAIIVGIRRTDPYGAQLKLQQKTDTNRGWPDFMRINPILEWHTNEIWYFLKWMEYKSAKSYFPITYCSLYDQGYTSLGGCDNTVRNPQLKRSDSFGYWPAWWVLEDDIERLSRVQKGKV